MTSVPPELKRQADNELCCIEVGIASAEGGWGMQSPLMPLQALAFPHHRFPHICSSTQACHVLTLSMHSWHPTKHHALIAAKLQVIVDNSCSLVNGIPSCHTSRSWLNAGLAIWPHRASAVRLMTTMQGIVGRHHTWACTTLR